MEINDLESVLETTQTRLQETVESALAKSDVSEEYRKAILKTLPFLSPQKYSIKNERWVVLPKLCCHACGGNELGVDRVTAAWYLFYIAAFLMDHAEDKLEGEQVSSETPGNMLNVASGFFFLANLILTELLHSLPDHSTSIVIVQAFQQQLLKMCDGQHFDLSIKKYTLTNAYEIARLKSGSFFSLACWSGARLATDNAKTLNAYASFGTSLGVIIQILDDLEDWQDLQNDFSKFEARKYQRILPALYANEVMSDQERKHFNSVINELISAPRQDLVAEFCNILEKAGAGLYMLTTLMKESEQAHQAITDLHPDNPADKLLLSMVESLLKF